MELLYIAIAVIVILAICYICILNKLNKASIKVNESLSGIDVALTKRHDVIESMVEVVKGYAKHEKEVMFTTIEIRKNMPLSEKIKVNKVMDKNLNNVNIAVEKYPELKASENFKELQKTIADAEEHLQAARRCYNANVSIYNQLILSFPTNIVAKAKKMEEKCFFEAEENKKDNIQVKL